MKKYSLVVISLIVALGAASAWAAGEPGSPVTNGTFVLSIHEDGTGTIDTGGGPAAFNAVMRRPKGPGVGAYVAGTLVPTWGLPSNVVSGDVVLSEGGNSDLIRFAGSLANAAVADSVQFFSDPCDEGGCPAADIGLPTAYQQSPPAGAGAAVYNEYPKPSGCTIRTFTKNVSGIDRTNTYNICSDDPYIVPSLTTWGMIALALMLVISGSMLVLRRRRALA